MLSSMWTIAHEDQELRATDQEITYLDMRKCILHPPSLAYGVYLMVFNQCMFVLRKRRSRPSDYLVGTAVSLFILITAHLVIDILRNMEAFTSNEGVPDFPATYYSTWDTWKNIVKSTLYVAVTLVSDAFILYRSFIVWRRNYLITTFPFLLFISDIAVGIYWVYTLSIITPNEDVFIDALFVRVTTFYSITLAMNIICTSLIAIKILIIQKAVKPFSKDDENQISHLVPIVVESGCVYSALLVVMIATYTSASPAMFIFLNSMSPIIGIVFSSVIVRVGLGLSHGDSHQATSMTFSKRHQWTTRASSRHPINAQIYSPSFPDGGAQVSLQQTIHTHIDGIPDDAESNISKILDYKSSSGYAI